MGFLNWLRRVSREAADPEIPLFCECNDSDCLFFLPIEESEYLETHSRYPGSALVLIGHEDDTDVVLERHSTHLVVMDPEMVDSNGRITKA